MDSRLGKTGTDKITGLKGVITGKCEYITGCAQLLLQPKNNKDNAYQSAQWFDENRITLTKAKKVVLPVGPRIDDNGPCDPAPKI